MSFVSILANPNFITVMTDGQVTRDGNIIQNDYKKFKKISPKQFIAYTGVKEICEGIINQIPYTNNIYDLADITNQIEQVVKDSILIEHKVHFGIGGLDLEGNIAFYTVENQKDRIVNYYKPISIEDITYAFFESGHITQNVDLVEKLVDYFRITGCNTPNKCLKAQKMLNDYISSLDDTVNKHTFSLTIKK